MDIPEKLMVNGKEFTIKKLLGKGKGGVKEHLGCLLKNYGETVMLPWDKS